MKITMLEGSSKIKESISARLLTIVESNFKKNHEIVRFNSVKINREALYRSISCSNALVISFPLYVDSVPAHLLQLLKEVEQKNRQDNLQIKIYCIINNGFFESGQNKVALEIIKLWCKRCKFEWGQGVCIGGGGMALMTSRSTVDIRNSLTQLSNNIENNVVSGDLYTTPNFPKFMYFIMANIGMYLQARKHSLKLKDMYKKYV